MRHGPLTTGADVGSSFTGTNNNDTFVATQDNATAANNTFNASDSLDGGAGTDSLNIIVQGIADNDALTAATVTNIERIFVRNVDATATDEIDVNASLFSNETELWSDRSTADVEFTNVSSGTTIGVKGNGAVTNAATTAAYGAGVTSGTLAIADGVTAGAITVNGTGLTSLTINSTGASNTTGAITTNGSPTSVTINAATALVTGGLDIATNSSSQAVTISGAADDVAATATAAAHSAVVLGTLDTDVASIDASGLTTGGVSATLSATVAATFKGGKGNDEITTSTTGQTGEIDAGDGTDTLKVNATADLDTTDEGKVYKNFEVLEVQNAAAVDMDNVTGSTITSVVLNDAGSATSITDMNATQAGAVTIAALTGAATLGVKNATQVGTSDTLKITVSDGDTTGSEAVAGTGDLTIAGVETIEITAFDDITLATMANVSGMTKLTVKGDGDVSIETGAMAVQSNTAVDFSGLTKDSTFDYNAATGNAISFTGGAGADTVSANVVGGNVIKTGAGNDTITFKAVTSGTSNNLVTGGAGADTTDLADLVGNDAQDQIVFSYAAGDSVSKSGSTNGVSITDVTDDITSIANDATAAAAAGNRFEIDTEVQATTVTFSTTAVDFGTTSVTTNGFYVFDNNANTANTAVVYQDTDGDGTIEAGEFAISLTGAAQFTTGEFTISSGDLIFTSIA